MFPNLSHVGESDSQGFTVANPGEGPGGPASVYFLDQTEARSADNIFFETGPPPHLPPLCQGLDDRAPHLSEGLDPPLVYVHQ